MVWWIQWIMRNLAQIPQNNRPYIDYWMRQFNVIIFYYSMNLQLLNSSQVGSYYIYFSSLLRMSSDLYDLGYKKQKNIGMHLIFLYSSYRLVLNYFLRRFEWYCDSPNEPPTSKWTSRITFWKNGCYKYELQWRWL